MKALDLKEAQPIRLPSVSCEVMNEIGKLSGVLTAKSAGWKLETGIEVNGLFMFLTEDCLTIRDGKPTSMMTVGLLLKAPDDLVDSFSKTDSSPEVSFWMQIQKQWPIRRTGYLVKAHYEEDTGDKVGFQLCRVLHRNGESAQKWKQRTAEALQQLVCDSLELKSLFDSEMEKLRKRLA